MVAADREMLAPGAAADRDPVEREIPRASASPSRPDLLTVQAHNPEQEEAEEEIEVSYQGEDLEIGFNVNYLLDALARDRRRRRSRSGSPTATAAASSGPGRRCTPATS